MTPLSQVIAEAEQLRDRGLLQEARTLLEDQMATGSFTPRSLCLLGEVCGRLLEHVSAIQYLETAYALNPGDMETGFILGVEYRLTGRHSESLAIMERLIKLFPDVASLHDFRGLALRELKRFPEAEQAFRDAVQLDPHAVWPMINLANLLAITCCFDEAEKLLLAALTLKPGLAAAQNDLGRLYLRQGRVKEAADHLRSVLELEPANRMVAGNILYSLCYRDDILPEEIAREHFQLAEQFYPRLPTVEPSAGISTESKLRIGYISSDFCEHSVIFFLEAILIHHDSKQFDIYCYANVSSPDETTRRLCSLNVSWRTIFGTSAEDAARQIIADRIDILVDLSGHTANNRLDVCALKPAPIIVSWLGYPHSTGMRQIDYYLSDAICDPPGMTDHLYREKVWRLPDIFCCYLPPVSFPPVAPLPCESTGWITFASFNNLAKVSQTVIEIWAVILLRIPESRLLLKSAALGGSVACDNIREHFSRHGIARERILLMPHMTGMQKHLAQYARVDIALDTFPYHGTTTTCEALWMGVPVITLAGRAHVSRVGVTLLHAVRLSGLVAETAAGYIDKAVDLASSGSRLHYLRQSIRGVMASSPLMDYGGVTASLEEAFRMMHEKQTAKGMR